MEVIQKEMFIGIEERDFFSQTIILREIFLLITGARGLGIFLKNREF